MNGMFLINGQTFDINRIDFVAKLNEVEQWEIFNESHMDHPFHFATALKFEVILTYIKRQNLQARRQGVKRCSQFAPL